MICWSAKRHKSDYLDGRLRDGIRSRVAKHLSECGSCAQQFEQLQCVRSEVGSLTEPKLPARLAIKLRVDASKQHQLFLETKGSRFKQMWNSWRFRFDEMMRPLTIPATGGIASSLILFSAFAFAFTIGTTTQAATYEVPLLNGDNMNANLIPVELRSSVTLTMSLDGSGRITDYLVNNGSGSFVGDTSRFQSDAISLPSFQNVLGAAQPISRDVRISVTPIVFRQ
jgi:hypothetical protein